MSLAAFVLLTYRASKLSRYFVAMKRRAHFESSRGRLLVLRNPALSRLPLSGLSPGCGAALFQPLFREIRFFTADTPKKALAEIVLAPSGWQPAFGLSNRPERAMCACNLPYVRFLARLLARSRL